jgi:metallo-beta-lactamase family protein
MVTGGRVLNYLEEFISHPETTEYSRLPREGTRGRKLLEGATEVKYMASTILFWQKIMEIKGFLHQEDLLKWLSALKNKP